MYETHFGFTSTPFQLNPDPDFYFDSRGHGQALAHLRYGIQQAEGFIVITGEIGAGKTTLVKALLQQLDPNELVAAQISNTQLDADNLLQSILTAFSVPVTGLNKAGMIARLEAFLTSLAARGCRALLVVDEAQNLSTQALEELRMLSNFQLGNHGLLQSFLVGQPELRDLLQLPSMRQLQQRVLATYHLGPLDAAETAAYVRHRLQHVGWKGQRPAIEASALSQLHQRSGGIPRRINLLCSRLLLSAYLAERSVVAADDVDEVADELGLESARPPSLAEPIPSAAPAAPAAQVVAPPVERAGPPQQPAQASSPRARKYKLTSGAVLAVAGDASAWGQLQLLSRHWLSAKGAKQPLVMLHSGNSRADIPETWREYELGHAPVPCVYLECPSAPLSRRTAALAMRFAELVDEVRPAALIIAGSGYDLVRLSVMARELGVPVVRLSSGDTVGMFLDELPLTADMLDRSADLVCVHSVPEHQRLLAQGKASWRVARVAPMTAALIRSAAPSWPTLAQTWAQLNLPGAAAAVTEARRFAVITAQVASGDLSAEDLMQWFMVARHAQDDLPLVWLAEPATADVLAQPNLQQQLRNSSVVVAPGSSLRSRWCMLSHAQTLIAGPGHFGVEEAQVFGLPSVVLHLRGERRAEWPGSGVAQVGPSQVQFLSALRESLRTRRDVVDPASLSEGGVSDVASRLSDWLKHGDALPFQLHARSAAA